MIAPTQVLSTVGYRSMKTWQWGTGRKRPIYISISDSWGHPPLLTVFSAKYTVSPIATAPRLENQLGDEALVNATVRRQWWNDLPFAGKQLSHGPSLGAALGNLYTYASAGYSVRWGDDAEGIPTLTPNPGSRHLMSGHRGWQWYLFANVEGYYMAQNLTLDGNTFRDSHSVDREEWVAEASAGLAMAWEDWQITYAAVQRTREFDGQDEQDKFGAVTLTKRF